jgi:large subunit ribosomal protein L31
MSQFVSVDYPEKGLALRAFRRYGARRFWAARRGGDDQERLLDEMKKEIHPNYGDATITCACGNVTHTHSTVKEMHVNTCSRCHPYYSGQSKLLDTEGRVQRFQKRYARTAKA